MVGENVRRKLRLLMVKLWDELGEVIFYEDDFVTHHPIS